ncbi:hypothetical protein OS189_04030 [Sulfitobacter sp. F26169L]|uniref:hypothetical protein n=1 Tax=Sulfitobacter sp. F26169L TaxID=2996015 RepID=UPI002260AE7B|nr:hypothetical protein [Sulfitobacter sp. F26169L]MCX7565512.1 hypothetical protein [Sulfitobacter sp. F26169L]
MKEAAQALSVLLVSTPATTLASMIAQIERPSEDLGQYVIGNAFLAHDQVFDTFN